MTPDKLKSILENHKDWIESSHLSGKRAELSAENLSKANLTGENLSEAILCGANLNWTVLGGASLRQADLNWTDLSGADLDGADLTGATLMEADLSGANLIGADLSQANIMGANLTGADLIGANLSHANLSHSNLAEAVLSAAEFIGAKLLKAKLTGAKLSGAKLIDADLSEADFTGADLRGADFTGAILNGAVLENTDMQSTLFSSKSCLNDISKPLTDGQTASAIFRDEQSQTRDKLGPDKSDHWSIVLKFMSNRDMQWDLFRTGMLFMSLQLCYNRILYLLTTRSDNANEIFEMMTMPCHVDARHDIHVKSITLKTRLQIEIMLKQYGLMPESEEAIQILSSLIAIIAGYSLASAQAYKTFIQEETARQKWRAAEPGPEKADMIRQLSYSLKIAENDHENLFQDLLGGSDVRFQNPVVSENLDKLLPMVSLPLANQFFSLYSSGVESIICESGFQSDPERDS